MAAIPENTLLALSAAASWGGGDFSGGMGVKTIGGSTSGALRVVILSHATSLALILLFLVLTGATVPHGAPVFWGLGCGLTGALSVTLFYIALARGAMGTSAAVSGLLAAAVPAVVSAVLEGAPGGLRLAGFVLALIAIWAVAAGDSPENTGGQRGTMGLAIASGLGFGFYFVCLRMSNALGVMEPIALARAASLSTCTLLLLSIQLRRRRGNASRRIPSTDTMNWQVAGWAIGVALLDTGGNLLFVAATRIGRLDVASVLASLYPAVTILLAAWRLQERPTRRQIGGMAMALAAVLMITL